jgi:hypothetical protein
LRSSLTVEVNGLNIIVRYESPIADFFNEGTSTIAKRQLVPDRNIPETWKTAISEIWSKSINDVFNT